MRYNEDIGKFAQANEICQFTRTYVKTYDNINLLNMPFLTTCI